MLNALRSGFILAAIIVFEDPLDKWKSKVLRLNDRKIRQICSNENGRLVRTTSEVHNSCFAEKTDRFLVLRGIAALTVVFNHFLGIVWRTEFENGSLLLQTFINPFGFQAVWLFLILSSYLLTKAFLNSRFTLDRASLVDFFVTRAWRLFPLFFATQLSLLSLGYIGMLPAELPFNLKRELHILFFDPSSLYYTSLNPVFSMNSPVWSVILEIHFIALTPILFFFGAKNRKILIVFVTCWLLVLLGFSLLREEIFPKIYITHAYNIGFFLFGAIAAFYRNRKSSYIPSAGSAVAVATCFWFSSQAYAHTNLQSSLLILPLIAALVSGTLIVSLDDGYVKRLPDSLANFIPSRFTIGSAFEAVGVMSYSLYLIHKPLTFFILGGVRFFSEINSFNTKLITTSVVIISNLLAAAVVYLLIESRFRARRKST